MTENLFQKKGLKDNSQLKGDTKDPKLIVNLIKASSFGSHTFQKKLMWIFTGYICFETN